MILLRRPMDPRVDSHTVTSVVLEMPDVTYYIKHTKATELSDYYPVLIFGAKHRSGTRYEIIPETGIPSSSWECLRAATDSGFYKHSGLSGTPMQISACPSEVFFISDGEGGICPRGRIHMYAPAQPAASWFRIARDIVSAHELRRDGLLRGST